ncbi:MAG: hypothetical protein WA978_04085 [Sphingopyxis granuli]|uniref:hypothetical protein n=1 Tax=Sphingopyxis granuli TaxID=267128 RepID=UPI003C74F38E
MSNNYEAFSELPEELQREALREGELRLHAQLAIATAADQRALTWGGLLVAAATGALGGGLALVSKERPDYILGLLAVFFAVAMMVAAWSALATVQPAKFCLPGNRPANWLPSDWDCAGSEKRKIQRARIDQAKQMSDHIAENAEAARIRAKDMARSFLWARWALWVSGAFLLGIIAVRFVTQTHPLPIDRILAIVSG